MNKVMIFIDWFYPAYLAGGPIKSVYHIVDSLSDQFEFYIVTSNTDIGGTPLQVASNQWSVEKNHRIIYLSIDRQYRKTYKALFEEVRPKVIYFNNMFSINFGVVPMWLFRRKKKVKQIVAPRGMLGEGALQLKPLKKKLFLLLAKRFLYGNELNWHASSSQEAKEVKKSIGHHSKVLIAQNLTTQPKERELEQGMKLPNELKLVFISRISEKKNLEFLLKLVSSAKEMVNLKLDVYGPIEDQNYWAKCKSLIASDTRIAYKGVLKPFEINETLNLYHCFVLPTLHENFGHAIAEAINAGVPVIISQFTPWRALSNHNVGFDISLSDQEKWLEVIRKMYALDALNYDKMVDACYEYSNQFIVNTANLAANKKLFIVESEN